MMEEEKKKKRIIRMESYKESIMSGEVMDISLLTVPIKMENSKESILSGMRMKIRK